MNVTMIGLQNAGKTSLLRVLTVSRPTAFCRTELMRNFQGQEFTIEYVDVFKHWTPKLVRLIGRIVQSPP